MFHFASSSSRFLGIVTLENILKKTIVHLALCLREKLSTLVISIWYFQYVWIMITVITTAWKLSRIFTRKVLFGLLLYLKFCSHLKILITYQFSSSSIYIFWASVNFLKMETIILTLPNKDAKSKCRLWRVQSLFSWEKNSQELRVGQQITQRWCILTGKLLHLKIYWFLMAAATESISCFVRTVTDCIAIRNPWEMSPKYTQEILLIMMCVLIMFYLEKNLKFWKKCKGFLSVI